MTPNYTNPVVKSYGLIPLSAVFLPLSTIFLALRLYTKACLIKLTGCDDIAASVGWMCTVAMTGILIRDLQLGNGAHIWNMTVEHFDEYIKTLTSAVILSVPAAGLPKVAVLVFYLKLNPANGFRYSTIAVPTLTWISIIAYLGIFSFRVNLSRSSGIRLRRGHAWISIQSIYRCQLSV